MMIKSIGKSLIVVSVLLASSCASIVKGTTQRLNVTSPPAKGAKCTLSNNKGLWNVITPGQVSVHKSFHDLNVVCSKKGYKTTHKKVSSNTQPLVFGNYIAGGIVGAGIDMADGAAYDYPQHIVVPLHR